MSAVITAVLALIGLTLTQWLSHKRWSDEQKRQTKQLKKDLQEQREAERAKDRELIEQSRQAIVTDATAMVDRYERISQEAHDRWIKCEEEHQATRSDMNRLAGQVDEMRNRIAESERIFSMNETEREKDRHVKHRALTALSVSETAMSTIVRLAQKCDCQCGSIDPMMDLINHWQPKYTDIVEENIMPTHVWQRKQEESD